MDENKGEKTMNDFEEFVLLVRALKKLGYCSAKVEQMSDSELELRVTIDTGGMSNGVTAESLRKSIELL